MTVLLKVTGLESSSRNYTRGGAEVPHVNFLTKENFHPKGLISVISVALGSLR